MNTLKSGTKSVWTSSKGMPKGKAKIVAYDSETEVQSECPTTVDAARDHMTSLYAQGWR